MGISAMHSSNSAKGSTIHEGGRAWAEVAAASKAGGTVNMYRPSVNAERCLVKRRRIHENAPENARRLCRGGHRHHGFSAFFILKLPSACFPSLFRGDLAPKLRPEIFFHDVAYATLRAALAGMLLPRVELETIVVEQ